MLPKVISTNVKNEIVILSHLKHVLNTVT